MIDEDSVYDAEREASKYYSWVEVEIETNLTIHEVCDLVKNGLFPLEAGDGIWFKHEVRQWASDMKNHGFWTRPPYVPEVFPENEKPF